MSYTHVHVTANHARQRIGHYVPVLPWLSCLTSHVDEHLSGFPPSGKNLENLENGNSGKIREFYSGNPVGTLICGEPSQTWCDLL